MGYFVSRALAADYVFTFTLRRELIDDLIKENSNRGGNILSMIPLVVPELDIESTLYSIRRRSWRKLFHPVGSFDLERPGHHGVFRLIILALALCHHLTDPL